MLCEVIGEPIKRLAEFIGEPIKLTGNRALRKALALTHCGMQVAINWCICQGAIPVPGAKTLKQAEDNMGSLGWRLSGSEHAALEAAADAAPRGMVQNVFQTS